MSIQTFEDYLQKQFTLSEPQILDDNIPDTFDNWIVALDIQEIIYYAKKWEKQQRTINKEELLNKIKKETITIVENFSEIGNDQMSVIRAIRKLIN